MPLLIFAGLTACGGGGGGGGGGGDTVTPPPPTPAPPVADFSDVTSQSGIDYVVSYTLPASGLAQNRQIIKSTNGGAAAGDCDGDSDIDLFITSGDGDTNKLYLNQLIPQGNGLSFRENAVAAGVANTRPDGNNDRHSGPTFADMDGDGDLDLFIGGLFGDSNRIYRNFGDCTFEDVTPSVLLPVDAGGSYISTTTISAAFGDYDLDGDLDLLLTHWATPDSLFEAGNPSETEHLFRNDSTLDEIRFTNVSAASGVSAIRWAARSYRTELAEAFYGFTPTIARLNEDLWPDIFFASDFGTTQALLNNGDFTFTEVLDPVLRDAQWGMGSALGDFDNDGDLDWFVTSIFGSSDDPMVTPHGNRLFLNEFDQGLEFTDVSVARGVNNGSWGWGTCFLDIDNDADLDLFHTNGWPDPFFGHLYLLDRSRAFVNDGSGNFVSREGALGLDADRDGRGVVCADFDHDGDIDILELTFDADYSGLLWENRAAAAGNNYLRVRLTGLAPNTEAAGARIFATTGTKTQMREVMIGSNFLSQNPAVQVFGLGNATQVDELRIEWPAIAAGPGLAPVKPADTVRLNVSASAPGQTLEISHP